MRNTSWIAIFAVLLAGCTLTFEPAPNSEEKASTLAALSLTYCGQEDGAQPVSAELWEQIRAFFAEESCATLVGRLAVVDYLDLSGFFVKREHLWSQISFLQEFPQIIHLKLSANQLTSLEPLESLAQLKYLYVDRNSLTSLEPLRGLGLVWLDASYNQLESIDAILGMPSLKDLYLEGNPIATVPDKSAWPQLQVLRF